MTDKAINKIAKIGAGRLFLLLALSLILTSFLGTSAFGAGWITSQVDNPSSNVGQYSSIALDSSNIPHICYYDYSNTKLKYAKFNGSTWTIEDIDNAESDGQYCSIAVNKTGSPVPQVSYYDYTNDALKHATRGSIAWAPTTIDTVGNVGQYTSIALDNLGRAHIAYCGEGDGALYYIKYNGTAWEARETVDASYNEYSSIVLDSSNNPRISYYDSGNEHLMFAKRTAGTWTTTVVDDSTYYVGKYSSVAIDPTNNNHMFISYYDDNSDNLKCAETMDGGSSWSKSTIDSPGSVGKYTSIAVDAFHCPHISYYDSSNTNLKYAKWNATLSTWEVSTVDSSDSVGEYTSIALDSNKSPHISYYDTTNDSLKYAYYDNVPPAAPTVSPVVSPVNADYQIISGTAAVSSTVVTITGGASTTSEAVNPSKMGFNIHVPLTQDATNTLSITATDEANNVSPAVTRIIVEDSAAPVTPVVNTPAPTNAGTVTITGTVVSGSTVKIYTDADLTNLVGSELNQTNFTISVDLPNEGSNYFYVTATDSNGNESGATPVIAIKDLDPPTGTVMIIGTDPDNEYTNNATGKVTLSFQNVQDDYTSVSQVSISNSKETGYSIWYTYPSDTNLYENWVLSNPSVDGTKTVYVRFKDTLGNTSPTSSPDPASDTIILDKTDPAVQIDDPDSGDTVGAIVEIKGIANDTIAFDKYKLLYSPAGLDTWQEITTEYNAVLLTAHLGNWDTSALPNANYDIAVQVYDKAGNTSLRKIMVTVNNSVSAPVIDSPVLGTNNIGIYNTDQTVSFHSGGNVDCYRYTIDGTVPTSTSPNTGNTFTATADDGQCVTYTVMAKAWSTVGNESAVGGPWTVIIDKKIPIVTINNPQNEAYVKGNVFISATVTEINRATHTVLMKLDSEDESAWTEIGTSTSNTISIDWNTSGGNVDNGYYDIKIQALDAAGNTNSQQIRIHVDNALPTASISSPTEGQCVSGTVNISGVDYDLNFARYELWYRTSDPQKIDWTFINSYSNPITDQHYVNQKLGEFSAGSLSDDSYILEVRVYDKSNNCTKQDVTVLVDNTPNTGSVMINNDNQYTNTRTVNLALSAAEPDVSQVMISNVSTFNGASWEPFTGNKDNWTLTEGDGSKTVYVQFK
ncbi:MAG: Ig-like domain-containing protein, partial [Candidatus Saganbacteria bacterium]|nr:Ig-like domain-containing protein [Candidatus Saganbacteria bacterium]